MPPQHIMPDVNNYVYIIGFKKNNINLHLDSKTIYYIMLYYIEYRLGNVIPSIGISLI